MQAHVDVGTMLLIIAALPQIWKTHKNRHNLKDISFLFSSLALIGSLLCGFWAVEVHQWSILLLNVVYGFWEVYSVYWIIWKHCKRKKQNE